MEYNIGDKFVVVGNSEGIHFFKLGDVVTYNGADFGERRSFKSDRLTQGLPLRDVVPYYDLENIYFVYPLAVQGNLGCAFEWGHTPEGCDYWWDQEDNGITPEGQGKLDAMIKQYEVLHQVIGAPTEEVVDIVQELEGWFNDFDEATGSSIEDGVICKPKIKTDGGPAKYYDLPPNAVTLNDLIEFKSYNQWLGDTAHLFNIFKAAWRWGIKEGTSKEYDARKFIYSGARLLMHYAGVEATRETLQKMLDDKQFGGK